MNQYEYVQMGKRTHLVKVGHYKTVCGRIVSRINEVQQEELKAALWPAVARQPGGGET